MAMLSTSCAASASSGVNLVDVANLAKLPAIIAQYLTQRIGEIFREQILNTLAHRFVAAQIENLFERRIQARDAAIEINCQQAQR